MIDKMRDTLTAVTEDAVAITRLQMEVSALKLAAYDRLADKVHSLQGIISTLERNLNDLSAQLDERDARIEKLKEEYKALQARQSNQTLASTHDERLSLFKNLEPLATQLPTLHQSVVDGADISAKEVLEMLAPLDAMFGDLGFKRIGKPGSTVRFDKTRHRAVGKGARSVEDGDEVRVRYVGYTHEGDVVAKAHVTAILSD